MVITRHGNAVARLVPNERRVDEAESLAAWQRIRERARQLHQANPTRFSWRKLKKLRDEGRPWEPAGVASVVIDSSITLAWVYREETTETVREVFQRVDKTGAWVPGLWRLEG